MSDRHNWITGAYEPVSGGEWVSFSYGPFPDQDSADKVADSHASMKKALGDVAADYEIDTTDPLGYGQACKHFEETLLSDHFAKLLPETHQAHLAAESTTVMRRS